MPRVFEGIADEPSRSSLRAAVRFTARGRKWPESAISEEVNLVPKISKYFVLAVACSLALCAGAVMANPDPAPVWTDLALADGYGHVDHTFNSGTNTFSFTVFNDQAVAGQKIGGWAVYPTWLPTGSTPTIDGVPPTGWVGTGWEGPVTGLSPQFGNIRDGFVATSDIFDIAPGASKAFTIQWISANLPTDLKFGLFVVRPTGTFWAQEGANPCLPVPDASTLVLAGSGALMALPMLKRSRKRYA